MSTSSFETRLHFGERTARAHGTQRQLTTHTSRWPRQKLEWIATLYCGISQHKHRSARKRDVPRGNEHTRTSVTADQDVVGQLITMSHGITGQGPTRHGVKRPSGSTQSLAWHMGSSAFWMEARHVTSGFVAGGKLKKVTQRCALVSARVAQVAV